MRVPLNSPTFDEQEIEAAIAVLRSQQLTMGQKCFEFEEQFARYQGVRNAIFVNSGSSANLLSFFALASPHLPSLYESKKKFFPGCEVIVPALTWSTTIWPIVQAGAIPVLVDSDPTTLQMDLNAARAAITDRTVAICPVHVLGNSVDMAPLLKLAKEHGLWVVEDTCEALGTQNRGQKSGTSGDFGTYSFFFSHHITTIEGGMVVTPHDEIADLLRSMRAHGWTRHLKSREAVENNYLHLDPRFLIVSSGFNLRPTEINAAFGIIQLKKLEGFNRRRIEISEAWQKALMELECEDILVPMKTTKHTQNTWFGFPVICANGQVRASLKTFLEKNGVETRPVICGNMAKQPAMEKIAHRVSGQLVGADRVMDCGLYWANHPQLSDEEVSYVSKLLERFVNDEKGSHYRNNGTGRELSSRAST